MAKENQGLQALSIGLFMLVILLGVMSFFFYRWKQEAENATAQAVEEAEQQKKAASTLLTTSNRLKEIIGFAHTDAISDIDEIYKKDYSKYAPTLVQNQNQPKYREIVGFLDTMLKTKNDELAMAEETLRATETRNKGIDAEKQKQIDQYKAAAAAAQNKLDAAQNKFTQDLQAANQQSANLDTQLEGTRKQAAAAVDQIESEKLVVTQQNNKLIEMLSKRNEKINEMLRPTFEAGDGHVRSVNQGGVVWINLGRADSLRRQMTFSVYPADTNDINRAGKKGEIEVTELVGEHLAEAKIVSDEIQNPIQPGDIIHTPVWAPGEQLHFAFSDGMDIDGDGKSDMELIRSLITMNDGVVDAVLDDNANRTGEMTTSTRFLVLGEMLDDKTPQKLLDERGRLSRDAKRLGIKTMALPELLRLMGWKNQTPVVRFGPGSNPDDFRPKPPDGVPKVSSGTVSPLFERRSPPRSAGSMY